MCVSDGNLTHTLPILAQLCHLSSTLPSISNDCADESIVTLQCVYASLVLNYTQNHVHIRLEEAHKIYVFFPSLSPLFLSFFLLQQLFFFTIPLSIMKLFSPKLLFWYCSILQQPVLRALPPSLLLSLLLPHGVSHLLNEESNRVRLNFLDSLCWIFRASLLAVTACMRMYNNAPASLNICPCLSWRRLI